MGKSDDDGLSFPGNTPNLSAYDDFMAGQVHPVESSNVSAFQYDVASNQLRVGYHGGGSGPVRWYGYDGISPSRALKFPGASSPGGKVWDELRVRGSRTAHQVPYSYLGTSPFAEKPLPAEASQPGFFGKLASGLKRFFGFGQKKAFGGVVQQLLGSGGDDEPIFATPGEYVVPRGAAQRYRGLLDTISGRPSGGGDHFARGGLIGALFGSSGFHFGGAVGVGGGGGDRVQKVEIVHPVPLPVLIDSRSLQFRGNTSSMFSGLGGKGPGGRFMGGSKGTFSFGSDASPFADSVAPEAGAGGEAAAGAAGPVGIAVAAGLAAVGVAAGLLQKGLEKTAEVMIAFTDPADQVKRWFGGFADQVSKWNPAAGERFSMALDNLSASVGRVFQPILDMGAQLANEFNVLYTSVAGPLTETFTAIITPLRDFGREVGVGLFNFAKSAFEGLVEIMQGIAPDLQEFGNFLRVALSGLGDALKSVAPYITSALRWVADAFRDMAPLLNIVQMAWQGMQATAASLRPVFAWVGDAIRSAIRGVVAGLLRLTATLMATVRTLREIISSPTLIFRPGDLAAFFGNQFSTALSNLSVSPFSGAAPTPPPTGGMTFAAQQARTVGLEDIGRQAREASLSQGYTEVELLQRILANVGSILSQMGMTPAGQAINLPGIVNSLFGGGMP